MVIAIVISVNYVLLNSSLVGQVKESNDSNSSLLNNDSQSYFDPNIYQSFNDEFTSESNSSWYNVAGTWSISAEGLHGGTADNTTSPIDNILISPVASRTLTNITTAFKINNIDPTQPNSVSIVYSATDPINYRQAGINIYKDDIYVRFADINNGSLTAPEAWPGVSTGMKFIPGSTLNMSLSIQNATQSLSLNGSEFPYNGNNTFVDGYLGLKYGKIKDIDFFNYSVEQAINDSQENNTSELITITNSDLKSTEYDEFNPLSDRFVVSDSETVLLSGDSLPEDSYIHLYDSSPYQIINGHIAARLPCDDANSTDVTVLIGQAPNLQPAILEYISPLSTPGEVCLYHVDLESTEGVPITDIAIQNNSTDDLEFPPTSSITIDINELSRLGTQ